MTREEIREEMLDILASIKPDANVPPLQDTDSIADKGGLDSMDFLDVLMELKVRYRIEVPDEHLKELQTIEKSLNYLEPRLRDFKA